MYVSTEELTTIVDEYKLEEITDNNPAITQNALIVAESIALSYLRKRYDIQAITAQKGGARSPLLVQIIKDIALFQLVKRHNIDILYKEVREIYDRDIDYLKAISAGQIDADFPPAPVTPQRQKAGIHAGSRPKFRHE